MATQAEVLYEQLVSSHHWWRVREKPEDGSPIFDDLLNRPVKSMVGDVDLEAVGLSSTEIESLYNQDSGNADIRLAELWTAFSNQILGNLRDNQHRSGELIVPDTIIVRSLDTPIVNASSFWCEDGSALIILNQSLIVLLWEASRLIAARCRVMESDKDRTTLVPFGEVVEATEAIFDWFRLSSQSHPVSLPLTSQQLLLAARWCRAMEEFVIAHEIAHVTLGHHGGCMAARHIFVEIREHQTAEVVDLDPDQLKAQEYAADVAGFMLVMRTREGDGFFSDHGSLIEGVRLLFRILEITEAADAGSMFPTAHRPSYRETHPQASLRSYLMAETLSKLLGGSGAWAQCGTASQTLDTLVEHMKGQEERDATALEWADATLREFSAPMKYMGESVPVPDYTNFLESLGGDASAATTPTRLAALARCVAELEPFFTSPSPEVSIAALAKTKLVVSAVQHLPSGIRAAFLDMYERAGGTFQDLFDSG